MIKSHQKNESTRKLYNEQTVRSATCSEEGEASKPAVDTTRDVVFQVEELRNEIFTKNTKWTCLKREMELFLPVLPSLSPSNPSPFSLSLPSLSTCPLFFPRFLTPSSRLQKRTKIPPTPVSLTSFPFSSIPPFSSSSLLLFFPSFFPPILPSSGLWERTKICIHLPNFRSFKVDIQVSEARQPRQTQR